MKSRPLGLQWSKLCSRTEAEIFKYKLRKRKAVYQKSLSSHRPRGYWVLHFPWWKNIEDSLGETFSYLLLVFWFPIHLCFCRKYQIFTPLQERDLKCPSHWTLNVSMFLSLSIVTSLIQSVFTMRKQDVLNTQHRTARCDGIPHLVVGRFQIKGLSGFALRPCLKNMYFLKEKKNWHLLSWR